MTHVSTPSPPRAVSPPLRSNVTSKSSPFPPLRASTPKAANRLSGPSPPFRMSGPPPPSILSALPVPVMVLGPAVPVKLAASATPTTSTTPSTTTVSNNRMRFFMQYPPYLEGGTRQPRRVTQCSLVCRVTNPGATSENARKANFAECPECELRFNELLRGCADRSWSAVRSAFPSVAHPAFSNQPPHDDHHLRERHPEIDHPPYPLRTPHQFLMRVMPRVRPLRHPTLP